MPSTITPAVSSPAYSYDAVPYPNHPFPQSHPDCLSTIARLFGMRPQPIASSRILELGCGRGGNVLPMAEQLPGSSLVGVELSEVQISEARDIARRLGLANLELQHRNILDVDAGLGTFDYIIAHGVYSWVPRVVQDKILDICRAHLNDQGVAYISYNTYPGWNMRGMIRDMMCYHTSRFGDPHVRIQQARALLDFLAQNSSEKSAYGMLLKGEVQVLRNHQDGYLFHEHLEDVNDPIYFYQFAERAAARGLQYLAEADVSSMYMGHLPAEVVETLERVANNLIQMEQYTDFLRNRMFRQTLLCRDTVAVDRELSAADLQHLYISSPVVAHEDAAPGEGSDPLRFRHPPSGKTITATSAIMKAMMLCLSEAWPDRLALAELLGRVRARIKAPSVTATSALEAETDQLGRVLLKFYVSGLIQLHSQPGRAAARVPAHPLASRLSRWQAEQGRHVTTLGHSTFALDDFETRLLQILDGRHDHNALLAQLMHWADSGVLAIQSEGRPAHGDEARARLVEALDAALMKFCRAELLLAHTDA